MSKPSPEFHERASLVLEQCYQAAEATYGRSFPRATISYALRGLTSGIADLVKNEVRLNAHLCIVCPDEMLTDTLPHEVAHLLNYALFGNTVKAHGREWACIMEHVLHVKPNRCHNMPAIPARKVTPQRTVTYTCGCQDHYIKPIKHSRMQNGQVRRCTRCRGRLVLKPAPKQTFEEALAAIV